MQLRVSDLLNDLHERTDLVEDRIEGIESKISQIQKNIESLPDLIGIDFQMTLKLPAQNLDLAAGKIGFFRPPYII